MHSFSRPNSNEIVRLVTNDIAPASRTSILVEGPIEIHPHLIFRWLAQVSWSGGFGGMIGGSSIL
jgi:hypothetical protein